MRRCSWERCASTFVDALTSSSNGIRSVGNVVETAAAWRQIERLGVFEKCQWRCVCHPVLAISTRSGTVQPFHRDAGGRTSEQIQ